MSELYKGYRHPKALIGYAVRLYLRYCLSYRDIQEILLERGIDITYETIRTWVYKWGSIYAQHIRKRKRTFNDKWHIDEVYLKINGQFTICGGWLMLMFWKLKFYCKSVAMLKQHADFCLKP